MCREARKVLAHPIEALKGEIDKNVEAIKKAGKVIKTVAKHVKKPGGLKVEKPSNNAKNLDKGHLHNNDNDGVPKVGKEDIDKVRKEWQVPEKIRL